MTETFNNSLKNKSFEKLRLLTVIQRKNFSNEVIFSHVFIELTFVHLTFLDCNFIEAIFFRSQLENCHFKNCKRF